MENTRDLIIGMLTEGVRAIPQYSRQEAAELVDRLERNAIERALNNYEKLLEDSKTLARLEDAGVDNWEGYNEAVGGE